MNSLIRFLEYFCVLCCLTLQVESAIGQANISIETVHPAEVNDPLPNPYMGYGLWAGRQGFGNNEKHYTVEQCTTGFGDDAPLFNWVLIDWDWSSLEPEEGQFNWQDFDNVTQYWSSRGKQIVVRLWVTDDSGWNGRPGADVLPAWVWNKGLKSHPYTGNGGQKAREPDYADPSYTSIYLPALQGLLRSFADRYDHPNTPVIFIQAMGYGHWADFATWYSKYQFSSVESKHQLLTQLLELYIKTFHYVRPLEMAAIDWDVAQYPTLDQALYSKALDVAASHDFGFIWTGFIDGLGGVYDRVTMQRLWRDHPIIAEGNWNYDDMQDQHTHGTVEENIDGAVDWHANFFHLYFVPETYKRILRENHSALEYGLKQGGIGYRLVPTTLSWPAQLPAGHLLVFHQVWVNRNHGRLYVNHPLKLYLTDPGGKEVFSEAIPGFEQASWIEGQTYPVMSVFHLPKTVPAGLYDVRIALVDSSGKPDIRLGIVGMDQENRYTVGQIKILKSDATGVCDSAFCP